MQTRLHLTAAATAVTTTVLFILAAISTTLLDTHRTANVRQAMLWALLVLVPALVITAATGFGVAGTSADPGSRPRNAACRSSPVSGCSC